MKEDQEELRKRLLNYKAMHARTAKNKDCYTRFMRAQTLTQARKILWGLKKNDKPLPKEVK